MKTHVSALAVTLALLLYLPACTSDRPEVPFPGAPFIGTWEYVERSDNGIETYDRLEAGAMGASFEIEAGGGLWFRHCAYVGGDWPTCFDCEGIWYEETAGALVLSYRYNHDTILKRLTVLYVDANEMRCRWSAIE